MFIIIFIICLTSINQPVDKDYEDHTVNSEHLHTDQWLIIPVYIIYISTSFYFDSFTDKTITAIRTATMTNKTTARQSFLFRARVCNDK